MFYKAKHAFTFLPRNPTISSREIPLFAQEKQKCIPTKHLNLRASAMGQPANLPPVNAASM